MKIVSFEGIDGAGKTTLVHEVASRLHEASPSLRLHVASEFASPIGPVLRAHVHQLSPVARAHGFAFERHWMLEEALGAGAELSLWDRYLDSSIALRMVDVKEGAHPDLMALAQTIVSRFPAPDRTFYIAVPPRLAAKRVASRNTTRPRRLATLQAQAEAYMQLYEPWPSRVTKLDGTWSLSRLADQVVSQLEAQRE